MTAAPELHRAPLLIAILDGARWRELPAGPGGAALAGAALGAALVQLLPLEGDAWRLEPMGPPRSVAVAVRLDTDAGPFLLSHGSPLTLEAGGMPAELIVTGTSATAIPARGAAAVRFTFDVSDDAVIVRITTEHGRELTAHVQRLDVARRIARGAA